VCVCVCASVIRVGTKVVCMCACTSVIKVGAKVVCMCVRACASVIQVGAKVKYVCISYTGWCKSLDTGWLMFCMYCQVTFAPTLSIFKFLFM
jgi:hypothetical protein